MMIKTLLLVLVVMAVNCIANADQLPKGELITTPENGYATDFAIRQPVWIVVWTTTYPITDCGKIIATGMEERLSYRATYSSAISWAKLLLGKGKALQAKVFEAYNEGKHELKDFQRND